MNIYQKQIIEYEAIFENFSRLIDDIKFINVPETTFTVIGTLVLNVSRMEEIEYKPFNVLFSIMTEYGIQEAIFSATEESNNISGTKIHLTNVNNITIDDFLCYYTKHMIKENNIEKLEFVIVKEKDDSKFGPHMLSSSGIAAFKVWDSNNNNMILMDHQRLAKILDIDLDSDYRDWDEHSLSILKLALPNS